MADGFGLEFACFQGSLTHLLWTLQRPAGRTRFSTACERFFSRAFAAGIRRVRLGVPHQQTSPVPRFPPAGDKLQTVWVNLPMFRKGIRMRDIAMEVYEKMRVGGTAWIRPVAAKGDTVESFQSAHEQARQMAEEGLISISSVKRQEDGLIDAIRILRLA